MATSARRVHFVVATGLVAVALGCGCSNRPSGALVIAVETDVPLPKDVDTIELQVQANGSTQFDNSYPVGMGALLVPATLTLLPGTTAGEPVTIRLLAYQNGSVRMLRQTITTVPTTRIATLLMPIQWLDFGMTTGGSMMDPGGVESSCGSDMTSDEGVCVSDKVDSTTLPDYSAGAVFGGGDGTGDGTCFDVLGCFSSSTEVKVPTSGPCTVTSPISGVMNVALLLSPSVGNGECRGDRCFVPLPMGTSGWTLGDNHSVQLPPGVCRNPEVTAVLLSTATVTSSKNASCESFATSTPLCGPWSSSAVGTPSGESLDGGAPDGTKDGGQDATVTFGAVTTPVPGGTASPRASITGDDASIYWTTAHSVMSFPMTGNPGARTVAGDAGAAPSSITLYATRLYWTNGLPDGSVMSVSTTGADLCTIASSQASPQFIANDSHYVYWTNLATGPDGGPIADAGTIMRAPTGNDKPSILVGGQNGPSGIAVDGTSIYWTNVGAHTVMKAALDGGAITTVTANVTSPPTTTDTPAGTFIFPGGGGIETGRITVDETSVYWTYDSADGGGLESTPKVPVDDASASFFPATNPSSVFVAGPVQYYVQAVDGGSVVVYTGTGQLSYSFDAGPGVPTCVFVNGTNVYWTNQAGEVGSVTATVSP